MESSIFSEWNKIPEGYVLLAQVDESESYEIDVAEVYRDTVKNKFVLVTASGCSCWDGQYEAEEYDNLEDIEKYLLSRDDKGYEYNPSLKGAEELVVEAKKNYASNNK